MRVRVRVRACVYIIIYEKKNNKREASKAGPKAVRSRDAKRGTGVGRR